MPPRPAPPPTASSHPCQTIPPTAATGGTTPTTSRKANAPAAKDRKAARAPPVRHVELYTGKARSSGRTSNPVELPAVEPVGDPRPGSARQSGLLGGFCGMPTANVRCGSSNGQFGPLASHTGTGPSASGDAVEPLLQQGLLVGG